MKLNPEVKAKWVEALRSGEYKQGSDKLRDSKNRFCSLGVLCDLHQKETGEYSWEMHRIGYSYAENIMIPPLAVREWADAELDELELNINGQCYTLFDHNDLGKTFKEIADAIEEQL